VEIGNQDGTLEYKITERPIRKVSRDYRPSLQYGALRCPACVDAEAPHQLSGEKEEHRG
jgi:hypothetical protein